MGRSRVKQENAYDYDLITPGNDRDTSMRIVSDRKSKYALKRMSRHATQGNSVRDEMENESAEQDITLETGIITRTGMRGAEGKLTTPVFNHIQKISRLGNILEFQPLNGNGPFEGAIGAVQDQQTRKWTVTRYYRSAARPGAGWKSESCEIAQSFPTKYARDLLKKWTECARANEGYSRAKEIYPNATIVMKTKNDQDYEGAGHLLTPVFTDAGGLNYLPEVRRRFDELPGSTNYDCMVGAQKADDGRWIFTRYAYSRTDSRVYTQMRTPAEEIFSIKQVSKAFLDWSGAAEKRALYRLLPSHLIPEGSLMMAGDQVIKRQDELNFLAR